MLLAEFKIYKRTKPTYFIISLLIAGVVISLAILIPYFGCYLPVWLFTICVAVCLTGLIFIGYIILTKRNNLNFEGIDINGRLEFFEGHANINGETFNYNECSAITIYYAGYPKSAAEQHVHDFGNYISFLRHGRDFKYYFVVNGESEKLKLIDVLESFYSAGIKFKEETNVGQSRLLRVNLTYSEVQKFKEKYTG